MVARNLRYLLRWIPVLAAAGYVLVTTYPYGPGITSDSIHYLTSARHLLAAGALTTYTDEPLVSYAPLLSIVYALIGFSGLGLQLAARLLSAFSFAAVVWITWRWLEEMRLSFKVLWCSVLLVLLARPLLWYAPYALSELPFIALTMCALWQAWRYTQNGDRANLIASGVCAGLSALMRWIGVTTIGAVGVFMLLACHARWRKRLILAAVYVLITLAPFVAWVLRNRLLAGTFFGVREPSNYPLREMVFDTLWSLHRWVVPAAFENSVSLFGAFAATGAVFLGMAIRLRWRDVNLAVKRAVMLLAVFIGLYALALVAMARGAKFEALSERLWSPIVVPLALSLILLWDMLWSSGRLKQVARGLLAITIAGWCVSGLAFGVEMIGKCFRDGPGVFNTSAWRNSETLRWLREYPLNGKVYSNFPEPLYYFTKIVSEQVPHKGPMRVASETHPRNLQQFLQKLHEDWKAGHKVYIVWFANPSRSEYLYSLEEMQKYLSLRTVKEWQDGKVLEVYPCNTSRAEQAKE